MGTTAITPSQVGTSPTAPLTFNGVSTYSSDFQSILTRAVSIASLPLTALQNSDADVLQQQSDLTSFGQSVSTLTSAFTELTGAVGAGGIQASSSDSTAVTATASGAQSAASYTINSITSLATSASETSTSGYPDSTTTTVSSTGSLQLVVGSQSYNITLATGQNNLNGLVNAINSLGVGVTASVLTTGDATNPDYLSISANSPGSTTLELFDDPTGANTDIITKAAQQGTDAVFQLNGLTLNEQSNTVNDVVPGLSFTLQAPSTTPTTLTLSASTSSLSSALNDFVTAYNGVQNAISGQTGTGGGSLVGSDVVLQASSLLRQIASFNSPATSANSTNAIQSLSDLGVTFDATGQASFDPTVLSGLNETQVNNAFTFIGTATSGFGALGTSLDELSDPVTGLIQAQQASYTATDSQLKTQITDLQARINTLQTATQSRLATMDALIASLQSQQTVLAGSIQSVDLALFGQNQSSPA